MRLRVTIQRHGLPPAQILWSTSGLRPNHAVSGPNSTVAHLLEQINEVIPLESEDWGLEDYAMEVKGFECLHFCPLAQILKDNDKVTIRPFHAADRRVRKVSGREQISADGRHLIDGVAFGRPFLRLSNRPAIKIPAMKHPRVPDSSPSNDNHDTRCFSRLMLRDNTDDESEDGSDEEYNGFEDSDVEDEVRDLTTELAMKGELIKDSNRTRYTFRANTSNNNSRKPQKRKRGGGLGIGGLSSFPDDDEQLVGQDSILVDKYDQEQSKRRPRSMKQRIKPSKRSRTSTENNQIAKHTSSSRQSSRSSTKSVRSEGDELETPATIRAVEDEDDSEDDNVFQDAKTNSTSPESNKENIEPHLKGTSKEQDETLSGLDSDPDSVLDDSDDLASITSSSDESSFELSPESSPGSTSSSESDQDNNLPTQTVHHGPSTGIISPRIELNKTDSLQDSSRPSFVAPGQGSRKTRKRNERRRTAGKLAKLKANGTPPKNATEQDFREGALGDRESEPRNDDTASVTALEAKKQGLLDAINVGDTVTTSGTGERSVCEVKSSEENGNALDTVVSGPVLTEPTLEDMPWDSVHNDGSQPDKQLAEATQALHGNDSRTPKNRTRLNVAASRRLLFGSLGLRAPKTKSDELQIRNKLMENARPLFRAQVPVEPDPAYPELIENGAWKSKINLKAVECCYNGVELSTPPFPFVQRWDRQQQGSSCTTNVSKGKKRKRSHKQQYDPYQHNDQCQNSSDDTPWQVTPIDHEFKQTIISGEPWSKANETQAAVDKQLLQDAMTPRAKPYSSDLMDLPKDLSRYQTLSIDLAQPKAIIAFKQINMSARTNWSPSISSYRTAVIEKVLENGRLELHLALRDRPSHEKRYDPKTGERLYSKFEMPDTEDDDDQYNGILEMSVSEMIEPKMLQKAQLTGGTICNDVNEEHKTHSQHGAKEDKNSFITSESKPKLITHEIDTIDENTFETCEAPITTETMAASDHVQLQTAPKTKNSTQAEISEDARHEYSLLIKNAGFRSNLDPDIGRGRLGDCIIERGEFSEIQPSNSSRLTLHSTSEGGNSLKQSDQTEIDVPTILDTNDAGNVHPDNRQTFRFSDTPEKADDAFAADGTWDDGWKSAESKESQQDAQPRDEEQDPEEQDNSVSVLPTESRRSVMAAQEYNKSRDKETVIEEENIVQNEEARSGGTNSEEIFTSKDGAGDSDWLPSPRTLFSQPYSGRLEASSDSDHSEELILPLPKTAKRQKPTRLHSRTEKSSQSHSHHHAEPVSTNTLASSSANSPLSEDHAQDSQPLAEHTRLGPVENHLSQPQKGLHVVDLTVSSDRADSDSTDKSSSLPRGPGWVQKTRDSIPKIKSQKSKSGSGRARIRSSV